ncbi:MAG TPA: hypothetical protein VIY53_00995 [Acidobacteriaceae bacterium]
MLQPNVLARFALTLGTAACCASAIGQQVSGSLSADQQLDRRCRQAAIRALGRDAEVLKCGHLDLGSPVEVIAAIRRRSIPADEFGGVVVWKLAVLRDEKGVWKQELLAADKDVRNPVGSVGIEDVDDSSPFWGFRVNLSNHRDDGKTAFELSIGFVNRIGSPEGLPFSISFNPIVGRYQEFDMHVDPEGFQKEIKAPRHFGCCSKVAEH